MRFIHSVFLLAAVATPLASRATTYNAATSFTITGSNAPFSYGYGSVTASGQASNAYTSSGTSFYGPGIDFFAAGTNASPVQPLVGHDPNGFNTVQYANTGNQLILHPGQALGNDSIVVFTAPVAGRYTGTFTVSRADKTSGGDGVTFASYLNGQGVANGTGSLSNNTLGGTFLPSYTFTEVAILHAGDVFTFDVGNNQTYGNDTTDFSASINGPSATPEPSSFLLLGTGVLSLAGAARRKLGRG